MVLAALALGVAVAVSTAVAIGSSDEVRSMPAPAVSSGPRLAQLLGETGGSAGGSLVRLDPTTLRPLPGARLRVGPGGCASQDGGTACWAPAWAVSPDGKRLALADSVPRGLRDSTSLRIVDPRRMRTILRFSVAGGPVGALAWLRPNRVLAVQELPGERQRVAAIDLSTRRVVARRSLGGAVQRLAATRNALALLVAPARSVGEARLAVVGADGTVRFARLPGIRAGTRMLPGPELRLDSYVPGLAVDPAAARLFVVAQGVAAEVDLRTLRVSTHPLDHEASFLSRLWSWLDPAALAKEFSGQIREAHWLGGGLLAVAGTDAENGAMRPGGFVVVDTHTWKLQTVDRGATAVWPTRDGFVATGGTTDTSGHDTGIGLAVYGLDGTLRFRAFAGRLAWAEVVGRRAYVTVAGRQALQVVDLDAGRVVGRRGAVLPLLLLGSSGGRWPSG